MSTLADLLVKVGIDDTGAEKGGRSISAKLEKTWDGVKKTAAVAGAAVGLALVTGIMGGLDAEAAGDRLAASLDATAAEAGRWGKVAGDLYAGAWGESIDQVNGALGSVVTSIEGMRGASDEVLTATTAKVLDMATAFEIDVARAAQVAGQSVKSGLAKDAGQALDLLTASLQRVPAAVRDDLLDALDEYGPFLTSIGVTGERAFGLLVKGAEKGMYGIDKTGDALKEFTIRATDMSTASKVGFDILGMSQEKMAGRLLKGGADGAKAFDQIVKGLLSIKDPVKQSQAALALFGTPLEDLSVAEIPKFLGGLRTAEGGLGEVAGAADRMSATLNDNAKVSLESFKRSVQQNLVNALERAIPAMQATFGWLSRNSGWVVPLVAALGTFAAIVYVIITAMKIWTAVQTAWGIVMGISLAPIYLIIIAIAAVIAIIVLIATKTTWFQQLWGAAWGSVKAAAGAVAAWFSGPFVNFFKRTWKILSDLVTGYYRWVFTTLGKVVSFVASLPGKIASAGRGLFDGLVAAGKGGINKLISLWNRLDFGINISIPSWVPGVGGKGFHVPDLFPDIPLLAKGGMVRATPGGTLAALGEGRHDEAVIPLPRGVRDLANRDDDRPPIVVTAGRGGTSADRALAALALHAINVGALQLTVQNGRVVARNG